MAAKRKGPPSCGNPDLVKRAEVLARTHYCDNYRKHEPHPVDHHMSSWLGGGIETLTCPGHATDDTRANFDTCVEQHKR